ncbi:PspC domain-containing protein [Desertibacillus haloalkaliphilus]|uniref:PspC domain-containing protein n=1 Tax=Desertibacillus haloalkaliphilus TaxID=1328930 RepID=UPI001C26FFF8|nr:PspC domain-containing protein [Desertibacillus haloalkaliphilus]MBU8908658.1 PspC domain-containing protein [Desertibacillus haloalkaliphilus]
MKRLYRTQDDRKLAGVCGGIARYFNMDPTILRIIIIVLALVTGFFPFVIGYIAAIFIVPNEEDVV